MSFVAQNYWIFVDLVSYIYIYIKKNFLLHFHDLPQILIKWLLVFCEFYFIRFALSTFWYIYKESLILRSKVDTVELMSTWSVIRVW